MKVYAVCPMSCDVACGHKIPDKIFGTFENAEKYVKEFYEYKLESHFIYEDDPEYTASWYYTPDGKKNEETNVVIIEYNLL